VQVFEEKGGDSRKVLVVGAHFTHTNMYDSLRDAIASSLAATRAQDVILIADTNVDASTTTRALMYHLAVPRSESTVSSELQRTCCLNDNFTYTFDRISANFGTEMLTTVVFEDLPSWVVPRSAFHKGVLVSLYVDAVPINVNPNMIALILALCLSVVLCTIVALCRLSRRSHEQRQILQRIIELGGLTPKVDTNRVSCAA